MRVTGEHRLEPVVIDNRDTGERVTLPASAVFVFAGADAQTDWLPGELIRDAIGYVCPGRDVMDLVAQNHGRWPLPLAPFLRETTVPKSSRPATCGTDR